MLYPHPPRAQAASHDLRRLLLDDAVSGIIGTPQMLMRNGRGHWYDLHRVGTSVKNRYLGEDSPEMAERVASKSSPPPSAPKKISAHWASRRSRFTS